ncbi:MAG: glycosyltransferase [Thermoanaerobaculia bacterium]
MQPPAPKARVSQTAAPVVVPTGALRLAPLPSTAAPLRLSVILPTYKEAKNIKEMVRRLAELLDGPFGSAYELIVVDDDSPDRTWELAQALTSKYSQLRVMRRTGERGLSTAVIRGWQTALGGVLAVIDADLEHPPEVILDLWREMERGADLAVASRHIEGGGVSDWSLVRRSLSRCAHLLGLLVLPDVVGRVSDPMSGYFMIRRAAIEGVSMNPIGYKILMEVMGRGKILWVSEVPYVFHERADGESKVTWKIYLEYLRHLLRLRISLLSTDRFARFAMAGASGVVVDMGLLFLLSDPRTLAWGLTRSKVIAAEVAIINNFIWNDRWTFRERAEEERGLRPTLKRFAKFQIICLAGLILSTVLLNLQFNLLGINRYVANAIAIAVVTAWNFWLSLKRVTEAGSPPQPLDASER